MLIFLYFQFHVTLQQVINKWSNIFKTYKNFRDNINSTGTKRLKKPMFHNEIHEFAKYRHIINPINVLSIGMPGDIINEGASTSNEEPAIPHHAQLSEPHSPPQKRRKRLRPLSKSEALRAELNEMNKTMKKNSELLEKSINQTEANRKNTIELERQKILLLERYLEK